MSKIIEKSKEKLKQVGNYMWDHRGQIAYIAGEIAGMVVMTVICNAIGTAVEKNRADELEKDDMVD